MSCVVRKPAFCICENKDADQLRGNRLCFAIRIVQSLYYLHPKFQASSHLLWLYSPVCVGPGQKPRRSVFFTTRLISEEEIRCIFDDNKLKDIFYQIFIKTDVLGALQF